MKSKLATRTLIALALASAAGVHAPSSVLARGEMDSMQAEGFANAVPKPLEGIGIDEHLGEKIDLDLTFKDENGQSVPLRSFVKDGKPVLLSLAYYACPSLCNFHMNGLLDAFKKMPQPLGQEFNAVVVSIEPKETPQLARDKKATYMKSYGRPEGEKGWHFLTGDAASIAKLAKQVGFNYRWDEGEQQYAHASAATVVAPDGKISRYLYGIVFDPKTIRLSMIEASDGKVGTVVDKLILYCFHFDSKASKYSLAAFNVMRAGGVAIVVILAIFLAPFWFRSRKGES
ncbi:MAG: SCO family protein [Bdellovibrionota bacterium]